MSVPVFSNHGCRLNAYEVEAMKDLAGQAGLKDAIVVNTCAVTAEAVRKAKKEIRRLRRDNPDAPIIVTGCAAQTEPETFAEMAEVLSATLGRHIQHVPISFEDFHANVAASGDDFVADVFTKIARETLDGRNAYVTDGVERALGRSPRDFADFAKTAASAGVWNSAA